MWWHGPYWYRRWWRFSLWPSFTAFVAAMLVVSLVVIAVMWPLSLWGHALGMTPTFNQLLSRSPAWMHQHYPLAGLRYLEAVLALTVVLVGVAWLYAAPGTARSRVAKYARLPGAALLILQFALPGGTSANTVPTGLLDKPLNAAQAQLRGFGIHSVAVGTPSTPGGLVDASGPTVCATKPRAGQPVKGKVTLKVRYTCATSSATVPPDLIGKELDIAQAELARLHLKHNEIDVSHSTFGILEPANWTVCRTYPSSGQRSLERSNCSRSKTAASNERRRPVALSRSRAGSSPMQRSNRELRPVGCQQPARCTFSRPPARVLP